jgi:micrococcal nuclease
MKTHLVVVSLILSTVTMMAEPIQRSEIHVKDGDTIVRGSGTDRHAKGQEFRLVGFDTPETVRGKCPSEIERGNRASARLAALLDSGKLDLMEVECSCAPNAKHLQLW